MQTTTSLRASSVLTKALGAHSRVFTQVSRSVFTPAKLPDMPYGYGDLEPVISGKIMELHHSKHHQAYVNNYNKAMEQYTEAESKNDAAEMINLQSAIRFNGGGHLNHSLFWKTLCPQRKGGGNEPTGELLKALQSVFGSYKDFQKTFNAQTGAIQGSGWGWLVYNKTTKGLQLTTTANQDPVTGNLVPLLGIDVWEHAYYLQYMNARGEYLDAIWKVISWEEAIKRYQALTKK